MSRAYVTKSRLIAPELLLIIIHIVFLRLRILHFELFLAY